jgi:hypothetical protein
VDKNNKELAFYLAKRWKDAPLVKSVSPNMLQLMKFISIAKVQPKHLDKQYKGRTEADLEKGVKNGRGWIHDGFDVSYIFYQEKTLNLSLIAQSY